MHARRRPNWAGSFTPSCLAATPGQSWQASRTGCWRSTTPLFLLPFAALPVDLRPTYLAERHAIRVIPTVLLRQGAPNRTGPFLGVGDPVYNAADPRWRGTSPSAQPMQMPRLVGSRHEIEVCAGLYGSRRPPVLLQGMDATQLRVEQELARNPSVVHFAVHAVESPKLERFLALSLSPSGTPEFLTPSVIASWRSHPGLVVLSSCSSARAEVLPATGLTGLTRAWLLAGADAVAASLWTPRMPTAGFFALSTRRLAHGQSRPSPRKSTTRYDTIWLSAQLLGRLLCSRKELIGWTTNRTRALAP